MKSFKFLWGSSHIHSSTIRNVNVHVHGLHIEILTDLPMYQIRTIMFNILDPFLFQPYHIINKNRIQRMLNERFNGNANIVENEVI
jgi:arylamine N-acetyltransferase